MKSLRKPRYARMAIVFVMLAGLFWINFDVLTDAYGAGPPYYSRTTNMDKWSNPLPWLLPINAVALILACVVMRYRRS